MKFCPSCKMLKKILEFYKSLKRKDGLTGHCKSCVNVFNKKYKQLHKKEVINQNKEYRKLHKEKIAGYRKEHYGNYTNDRIKKDPIFRLTRNLRARLYRALQGNYKLGSAVKDLGCSVEFLKSYLESKFLPGMTWKNHGCGSDSWHIDHIVPLDSFNLTDREQLLKAVHYTNLQPLWQSDNLRKSSKILDLVS